MSHGAAPQHQDFLRQFVLCEPALRGFVRSLVPTLHDANDVMQEVAILLWEKYGETQTPDDFRRWAFAVAKWKVLSWKRDRMRDRHLFGDATLELLATETETHSERLEIQRQALSDCLKKLPAPQRDLVQRAYAPRTRIDELAEGLGMTAMALYKKLHRIRALLVDCTQRAFLNPPPPSIS